MSAHNFIPIYFLSILLGTDTFRCGATLSNAFLLIPIQFSASWKNLLRYHNRESKLKALYVFSMYISGMQKLRTTAYFAYLFEQNEMRKANTGE